MSGQQKLFNEESISKAERENKEWMWRQFANLGEMMGDGLHHEKDGKWITKEYNALAKVLIPDMKLLEQRRREARAKHINEQMKKILEANKCDCGGLLVQARSGSKVCYCIKCNARYKAGKKPKTKK